MHACRSTLEDPTLGANAPNGQAFTQSIVVGNHFEFGGFSIELAAGAGVGASGLEAVVDLGLGWRVGQSR